ncbi:MAG: leucine-rich repeat domain-containing protein [Bacteroidales bacterium]|nr:leucine-rich repeat domain-containing protein [Bacteroidales bacterium]
MQVNGLQLKRALRSVLIVLLLSVAGIGKTYAYDFSATVDGSTWYFNIIDTENHYVEVTYLYYAANYNSLAYSGAKEIPSTVDYQENAYTVTAIGGYAFYRCNNLTSVTIPNTITSIGTTAFYYCYGLTSLAIPNSVTTIGDYAFYNCYGLTSMTIGDSVETIGAGAFKGCRGLTSIDIPNSVTSIGNQAFYDCYGLTSLTIGNSIASIGEYAFVNCCYLTSFVLPASVVSVGVGVLASCVSITELTVSEGNTVYDSRDNCNAIIETATNTLVAGCNYTVIPSTVTAIGSGAFSGCTDLTSITIPDGVTAIGEDAFYYCYGLTSIIIPDLVTSIGNRAFYYCADLTSVTLGNSVETIGADAFEYCLDLESITLPGSVTSIGENAFLSCGSLATVNMLAVSVPTLGGGYDFYGTSSSLVIYVPYESLDAYKTAEFWSDYADIMQPMAYKSVAGYGTGNGNWAFIASPLTTQSLAPIATGVENMITQTAYDLYRFDQSEELEWQNYKANTNSFVLENGQGYLYANVKDANVIFKGAFNEDDTKEVELAYDADAEFAGWNLVGNPFPVSAYANRSYYTMNEAGTAVEPNMVSSAIAIHTCTGVMVKADDQGETVVFNTTAPETASNKGGLRIALSQVVDRGVSTGSTTLQDKAIVSFNASDRLEKFIFNKDNASISISQGGKDLAIASADKQGEMPLNFKATKNGTYTLSVNVESADVDYLHLIDNLTGADVDLLVEPNYTFEAKSTDYASRFRLVFNANETDGPSTGSGTFAFINSGNIIVTGVEADAVLQIVDVTGRVLVSRKGDAMNRVSTNGMTPGVYVLRLIHSNGVKTQKIVID